MSRQFFPATEFFSYEGLVVCSSSLPLPNILSPSLRPGMNDGYVYGQVIANVPAPKLVEEGYILPPKVVVKNLPTHEFQLTDSQNLIESIEENSVDKILVAARSTKQIIRLMSHSDFQIQLTQRGYSCMYITSKTGVL